MNEWMNAYLFKATMPLWTTTKQKKEEKRKTALDIYM